MGTKHRKTYGKAMIFKNDEEKYVNINKNDLYKDIMLKLKVELTDIIHNLSNSDKIHTNLSSNIINILSKEKYIVMQKYNDYESNKDIRNIANQGLENILLKKSHEAEDIAKKYIDQLNTKYKIEGY